MKKIIKEILKYSVILVIMVIMLLTIMLITIITIPREKIEENIKESIPTLKSVIEVKRIKPERHDTYLHVYADEILLNMIYCMDTDTPLKSMMEAKYYEREITPGLEGAVENQSSGNTEYIRYWHGSMAIIRPLLVFFNIDQIYYIFAIILAILLIILFAIFIKKKYYILLLAMIIGLIMTSSIYVPFCLEYVWTYIIMLSVTIVAIYMENKESKKNTNINKNINTNTNINTNININILMFITGIITCFFDFLSTETITFLVPIICIETIRYKENRIKESKKEIKQIAIWICLWLIGYGMMWAVKWLLASIILNINALDYVTEKAMIRINGNTNEENIIGKITNGLTKNFLTLYPLCQIKSPTTWAIIIISIFIIIVTLSKRDKEEIKKACIMLILGTIPYIRYIVLASHSTTHRFFTFRAQIATIIAVIVALYIIIDKNRLKKEKVFFGRKYSDRRKRANNTNPSVE